MVATGFTPLQQVVAVLVELDDAVVAAGVMPVRNEDIAVWRHQHVGGFVEHIVAVTGNAFLTERHQQLAVRLNFITV